MDDVERNVLIKALKKRRKEATSSKENAILYLQEIGILTIEGKLSPNYGGECIPNTVA